MPEDLIQLIDQLIARSTESQTVEFKASNDDAFMIGKDISALSNAAAIEGQDYAYMLWGVDDATHGIIGTTFNPLAAKHKGQELELWLRLKLSKNAEFKFIPMDYRGHRTVILRIWPATGYPVAFDGTEYIRSGTSTQPIAKNSQRERRLWEVTKSEAFEDQIAAQWLTAEETLAMLDWNTYFRQTGTPLPSNRTEILHYLESDHIIKFLDSGSMPSPTLGHCCLRMICSNSLPLHARHSDSSNMTGNVSPRRRVRKHTLTDMPTLTISRPCYRLGFRKAKPLGAAYVLRTSHTLRLPSESCWPTC